MTEAAKKTALSPDAFPQPQQRINGKFAPGHTRPSRRAISYRSKAPAQWSPLSSTLSASRRIILNVPTAFIGPASKPGRFGMRIMRPKPAREAHLEPLQIEHSPRAELTFAGAAQSQPDPIERAPVGPAPAPELDPILKRAMEMGYTPLPRRVRLVD